MGVHLCIETFKKIAMAEKDDDKPKKLGDIFRKGVQGLRDRMNFDSSDLIRAVDKGDVEMVERIMYAGFDPNQEDGIRRLALPMAIDNSNMAIVGHLLKGKADPNKADKEGDLPLRKAVYWENMDIIQMLLIAGADSSKKNSAGVSAMDEAQKNNYTVMIDLMENFKDPERVKQIEADKIRHEEMKEKAANAKEQREEKAEEAKIEAEKERAEKAALELSDLEKTYQTEKLGYVAAIIKAIQTKDSKAVKLFSEKAEDLNVVGPVSKKTPLYFAVEQQHTKLAFFFIGKGADPFFEVPTLAQTPFAKAVSVDLAPFVENVLQVMGKDAPVILNDPDQLLSPQFMAYKSPRMFDLLLTAGADPLFGGKEGLPPILKAVEKGSVAILPVLARHEFDLDLPVNGDTLLEWAMTYQRMDWVNGLLQEGADIDGLDEHGRTPLMMAVELKLEEAVELLLDKGADATIKNAEGKTALEIAQEMEGVQQIVDLLN